MKWTAGFCARGSSRRMATTSGDPSTRTRSSRLARSHVRRTIESSPFESGCESLPEPRIEDDGEQRDQNDENEDELKKHDRKLEGAGGG